ncbi:hypothetical protein [Streptomyces sp. NBC_00102]|uniref:hypothetical protein n=1 Tax=Streptomyces sp. NBC_00102 TaxID=2975652 RepID=UPI002255AEB1|nr:hypothetical protein [Streptomyces sp. NBC_00102]MCX5396742.1 hypothetical protein [Streptomyces sp. NBC_00102]
MSFPRVCIDCDRVIIGAADVVANGHSASGARPDIYAHPDGDPACAARRVLPSLLHQALDDAPPTPARGVRL